MNAFPTFFNIIIHYVVSNLRILKNLNLEITGKGRWSSGRAVLTLLHMVANLRFQGWLSEVGDYGY